MELYEVMRSTFSARKFTAEPLPDEILYKILDNARFAPSGGNRQGAHVIIVRNRKSREKLVALSIEAAQRYTAQVNAGENAWNSLEPTRVEAETIEQTIPPSPMLESYLKAAVVLVICVDLEVVASVDQYLDRVGIVSGASIYPLVWNILMSARREGYGGTLTTLPVSQEPALQKFLGIPSHVAVCAVLPLGKPVKQLTRLKRKPVSEFAVHEYWGGKPLAD